MRSKVVNRCEHERHCRRRRIAAPSSASASRRPWCRRHDRLGSTHRQDTGAPWRSRPHPAQPANAPGRSRRPSRPGGRHVGLNSTRRPGQQDGLPDLNRGPLVEVDQRVEVPAAGRRRRGVRRRSTRGCRRTGRRGPRPTTPAWLRRRTAGAPPKPASVAARGPRRRRREPPRRARPRCAEQVVRRRGRRVSAAARDCGRGRSSWS